MRVRGGRDGKGVAKWGWTLDKSTDTRGIGKRRNTKKVMFNLCTRDHCLLVSSSLSLFHRRPKFFCAAFKMSLNSWTSTKSYTFFIISRCCCRYSCCCWWCCFFFVCLRAWFRRISDSHPLFGYASSIRSKCTVCTYCVSSLCSCFFRLPSRKICRSSAAFHSAFVCEHKLENEIKGERDRESELKTARSFPPILFRCYFAVLLCFLG